MASVSLTAPRFERDELAAELSSLSLSDLTAAQNDLFGRDGADPDSEEDHPSKVQAALQALAQEIRTVQIKPAFLQAMQRCPGLAKDEHFWMMFLRAEMFDVGRAAERVVRYWEEKLKLFGPEKTFRRLTIHDLEHSDVGTLREGGLWLLPGTDAAGRGLLFSDWAKWNRNRDSMMRILWYLVHSSLEDEKVQKNGLVVVGVSHLLFTLQRFDRKLNNRVFHHCRNILPVRIRGVHLIVKSVVVKIVLPFLLHAMGKELRARFCMHSESNAQLIEELDEYGISADKIPLEFGGTLDHDFDTWWDYQRARANSQDQSEKNPLSTTTMKPSQLHALLA